jgi:PKD repeat protein
MRPVKPVLSVAVVLLALIGASSAVGARASADGNPKAAISILPGSGPLGVKFAAMSGSFPTPVVSYKWTFGDGFSSTGPAKTVAHEYVKPGTFTVTVTETDAGGHTASAMGTLKLFDCPASGKPCSTSLSTPAASVTNLAAQGPSADSQPAWLHLFTDPWRFNDCDPSIHNAVAITDSGFTGPLTVTLQYKTSAPSLYPVTCYSSAIPFTDSSGATVTSGALRTCQASANRPPCLLSSRIQGTAVTKVLRIPPGDPRVGAA